MNCLKTGIIKLKDLPQNKILIGLNKNFKKDIIKKIKNNYKIKDFCKKININLSKFYNFKDNEKITLKLLNKMTKELKIKNIEKYIEFLGTKRGNIYIKNPKIPFKFNNKEGVQFISALLFDGGIDRENKPHYGNIHRNQREDILNCALNIFGKIDSKEIDINRNNYFIRFPKTIGIILEHCLKIKKGQKVYINHKIPEFIFNLNKDCKRIFIKQAFDDDGTIIINKKTLRISGTIDISNKKNNKVPMNLMTDLQNLVKSISIETNKIRKDKTFTLKTEYRKKGPFYRQTWSFSITGRNNLLKYYKDIGFNLKYKQDKLKRTLDSYKNFQLRKGEIKKIALEKAFYLQNKNGYFNNITLTKEINRQYRQTVRITEQLLKEGKIKIKEKAIPIGKGWIPTKFILNLRYNL